MAAMVAGGSSQLSPSVSVQDNGSKNKRKSRTDPPLGDPNKVRPHQQMDCPNYELGKSQNIPNIKQHSLNQDQLGTVKSDLCTLVYQGPSNLGCDGSKEELELEKRQNADWSDFTDSLTQDQLETVKSDLNPLVSQGPPNLGCDGSKEELELEKLQDADWSDVTETQLEELCVSNLDIIFKSAIKKIVSYGYSEDAATKALLRLGICYGCKDTVSNIVENTLAFLKNEQEAVSSGDYLFEDLQQLERYVLVEMVCVLQQVRPSFSSGDAMWSLLICDMNMSHVCTVDGDHLSSFGSDETGSSSVSMASQLKSEDNNSVPSTPELANLKPKKPNHSTEVKGSPFSLADTVEESSAVNEECVSTISRSSLSQSSAPEEKSDGGRKWRANSFRRESAPRQKSIHLEKTFRAYGTKGSLRSGKLSGLSSFFSDKKYKSVPDSATSNLKNASLKISKTVGVDSSQRDGSTKLSIKSRPTYESDAELKAGNNSSGLPLASTELSLSLLSESNDDSRPTCNVESANCGFGRNSSNKVFRKWNPNDKDDMLLKLVRLQAQIQEWKEWGEQKVFQATHRLLKDKVELNTLKQEKKEVVRVMKEKQTLEENTMKKLVEMENALCKAGGQVERANATVRRLEVENCELRQEMEAAKLRAAESALSCQEVTRREKKTLKKFESWERQKALFQEELVTEKSKLSQLQQQLAQAKELQNQLEARWRQEEKVKEETLMRVNYEKKERERIEASAKSKEDILRLKAESGYRDDIQRLEKEIAHFRLKTGSSKLAALHWDTDNTYAPALKEINPHCISDMIDFQDSERECVMCLTDEMSVVFLPCAHQVVCMKCNELHQKQGMKDCPSCRTPIDRRVCVRSADS